MAVVLFLQQLSEAEKDMYKERARQEKASAAPRYVWVEDVAREKDTRLDAAGERIAVCFASTTIMFLSGVKLTRMLLSVRFVLWLFSCLVLRDVLVGRTEWITSRSNEITAENSART